MPSKTVHKRVVVSLQARLGKGFAKVTAAGKKAVAGLGNAAAKAGKAVALGGAAIVAGMATAAAGMAVYAKRQLSTMDATGKLSDRLGIATEKLVAMRHAADLSGVSAATLDKGLEGYTRRLGEAIGGTGTAADALKTLGLSAGELSRMPLDQQMGKLADAIRRLPTEAQRAAAANDLFGRSGAAMLPMLNQGADGMRTMMQEADRLGITYTRSQAAMAERTNDAMTRIKAAFAGAGQGVLSAFLPAIESMIVKLQGFITAILPTVQAGITAFVNAAGEIWGILSAVASAVFDSITGILESFGITLGGTGDIVGAIFDGIVSVVKWFSEIYIKTWTFLEAVIVNWKDALTWVFKGAALAVISFALDVAYWFTDKLPAYLEWFARNWRALFNDMWEAGKAVIGNLAENMGNFFSSVGDWLTGEDWDYQWKPLLDGFQRTTEKLPEIAERSRTAIEQSLAADVQAAADNIGGYYEKRVAERLGKIEAGGRAAEKIAAAAASAGTTAADQVRGRMESDAQAAASKAAAAPAEKARSGNTNQFGVLSGRMSLAAMANGQGDVQQTIASNTARAAKASEATARTLKKGGGSAGAVVFVP